MDKAVLPGEAPTQLKTDKQCMYWLNRKANTSYDQISDVGDAVGYCIVFKKLFPNSINYTAQAGMLESAGMKLTAEDKKNNWKRLQSGFKKVGIDKKIDTAAMVRGNVKENFEFIQWFVEFYNVNVAVREKKKTEGMDKRELISLRRVESAVIGGSPLGSRPSFMVQGIEHEFESLMKELHVKVRVAKDESDIILQAARVVKAGHLLNMDYAFERFAKIQNTVKNVKVDKDCPMYQPYKDVEDCLLFSIEVHDDLKAARNDVKQNEKIIRMYHLMTEMKTAAGMIKETRKFLKDIVPNDVEDAVDAVIKAYNKAVQFTAKTVIRAHEEIASIKISEAHELSLSFKKLRANLNDAADTAKIVVANKKTTFQTSEEKALWHCMHWAKVTADTLLFLDMSGY